DELSAPAPVPAGRGWPPYARGKSVLECVHVWWTRRGRTTGSVCAASICSGAPRPMLCRNRGHLRTMQRAGHSRAGGRQYPPVNILCEPSLAGRPLLLQRPGQHPASVSARGDDGLRDPNQNGGCVRGFWPFGTFYRSADEARCAQRTEYLYDIATLPE